MFHLINERSYREFEAVAVEELVQPCLPRVQYITAEGGRIQDVLISCGKPLAKRLRVGPQTLKIVSADNTNEQQKGVMKWILTLTDCILSLCQWFASEIHFVYFFKFSGWERLKRRLQWIVHKLIKTIIYLYLCMICWHSNCLYIPTKVDCLWIIIIIMINLIITMNSISVPLQN